MKALIAISISIMIVSLLSTSSVWSLGEETIGNKPVHAQPQWPQNILPVINDSSRVYRRWINGNEEFFFVADQAAVNRILAAFAEVKIDKREFILRPDSGEARTFDRRSILCNVKIRVPSGIYLHQAKRTANDEVYCSYPQLVLYLGDGKVKLERLGIFHTPMKLASNISNGSGTSPCSP